MTFTEPCYQNVILSPSTPSRAIKKTIRQVPNLNDHLSEYISIYIHQKNILGLSKTETAKWPIKSKTDKNKWVFFLSTNIWLIGQADFPFNGSYIYAHRGSGAVGGWAGDSLRYRLHLHQSKHLYLDNFYRLSPRSFRN